MTISFELLLLCVTMTLLFISIIFASVVPGMDRWSKRFFITFFAGRADHNRPSRIRPRARNPVLYRLIYHFDPGTHADGLSAPLLRGKPERQQAFSAFDSLVDRILHSAEYNAVHDPGLLRPAGEQSGPRSSLPPDAWDFTRDGAHFPGRRDHAAEAAGRKILLRLPRQSDPDGSFHVPPFFHHRLRVL